MTTLPRGRVPIANGNWHFQGRDSGRGPNWENCKGPDIGRFASFMTATTLVHQCDGNRERLAFRSDVIMHRVQTNCAQSKSEWGLRSAEQILE